MVDICYVFKLWFLVWGYKANPSLDGMTRNVTLGFYFFNPFNIRITQESFKESFSFQILYQKITQVMRNLTLQLDFKKK
jgi:hypothetical protein